MKRTGSYRWWGWGRSAGSRRTAGHCETRWSAWLCIEHSRFCFLRRSGEEALSSTSISLYLKFRWDRNIEVSCLQLVEPWRAGAAPSAAVHVSQRWGCIPRPMCASPPGLIEGGKREKEGWAQMGGSGCGCAAHVYKRLCGTARVGDNGLSRCSSPHDETRTQHLTASPPATHLLSTHSCLSFSTYICLCAYNRRSWNSLVTNLPPKTQMNFTHGIIFIQQQNATFSVLNDEVLRNNSSDVFLLQVNNRIKVTLTHLWWDFDLFKLPPSQIFFFSFFFWE